MQDAARRGCLANKGNRSSSAAWPATLSHFLFSTAVFLLKSIIIIKVRKIAQTASFRDRQGLTSGPHLGKMGNS